MAKITLTKDNLLSLTEFQTLLEQLEDRNSPLEDILGLLRQLIAFEQQYNLASDVFYARFMRGEMGDDLPFIKWAGRYELYLEAKQELNQQLADMSIAA
jgi:hypothetical protein